MLFELSPKVWLYLKIARSLSAMPLISFFSVIVAITYTVGAMPKTPTGELNMKTKGTSYTHSYPSSSLFHEALSGSNFINLHLDPNDSGAVDPDPKKEEEKPSIEELSKKIALFEAKMTEKDVSISKLEASLKSARDEKKEAEKKAKEIEKQELADKGDFEKLLETQSSEWETKENEYKSNLGKKDELIRQLTIGNDIKLHSAGKVRPEALPFIESLMTNKLDVNLETGQSFVKGVDGRPEMVIEGDKMVPKTAKHLFEELYKDKNLAIYFLAPSSPSGGGANGANSPGGIAPSDKFSKEYEALAKSIPAGAGQRQNALLFEELLKNSGI